MSAGCVFMFAMLHSAAWRRLKIFTFGCDSWPVGLMDKASASGAGDSRFESWAGHYFHETSSGS